MEVWLKRYLGLLFDFKLFSILNLLAIPLFLYFFISIRKRKRWEKAIAFVFILSLLILEIKGGYWYRYVLTLYPFILATIFLSGWEIIKNKSRLLRLAIFLFLGIAASFSYYHSRELYSRFWRYKVTLKDNFFPSQMFKFINAIEDSSPDSMFLVYSGNYLFYYHGNKKGIYYADPRMRTFIRQQNEEKALDVLRNQLKIKYILIDPNFKTDWIGLLINILANDCDLIYQEKGYYLYKLCERELSKEELEKVFINASLLKNGSFENWTNGPLKNPDFFEGSGGVFRVEKELREVKVGNYSAKIIGDDFNFSQDLPNYNDYKGKSLACFAWIKTSVSSKYRIQIYDGVEASVSKRHWGGGGWELLQVSHKVNPRAEFVRVRVIQADKTGKADDVVYVDGALLVEGDWNTFYLYELEKKKRE